MNLIEKYHLKFMEWHYSYVISHGPGFKNEEEKSKQSMQELEKLRYPERLIDLFGSSYVDENDNSAILSDGPYEPSSSQVWAIFECPQCKTRKMGIQTSPPIVHASINCLKKSSEPVFYEKIKRNLTWEQVRKEKLTDPYDIFGFGIPVENCPYGKIPSEKYDIDKEIKEYIEILDERVEERKKREQEKIHRNEE